MFHEVKIESLSLVRHWEWGRFIGGWSVFGNGKMGKESVWDLVSVKAKLLYCCMFWLQRRYKQAWCMHFRPIRTAMLLGSWIARLVIVCLVAEQNAIVRSHAGCRCVMYRTRAAIERHSPNFLPFWGYIYVNQCDIFFFIFPVLSLSLSFPFPFSSPLSPFFSFLD